VIRKGENNPIDMGGVEKLKKEMEKEEKKKIREDSWVYPKRYVVERKTIGKKKPKEKENNQRVRREISDRWWKNA